MLDANAARSLRAHHLALISPLALQHCDTTVHAAYVSADCGRAARAPHHPVLRVYRGTCLRLLTNRGSIHKSFSSPDDEVDNER